MFLVQLPWYQYIVIKALNEKYPMECYSKRLAIPRYVLYLVRRTLNNKKINALKYIKINI